MQKVFFLLSFLMATSVVRAQVDKVAVISVYADRQVDPGEFTGLQTMIDMLSKDSNFNLDKIVTSFHERLFIEFNPLLPFAVFDEKEIINTDKYRQLSQRFMVANWNATCAPGYFPILSRGLIKDKNNIIGAFDINPEIDAVMVAFISFRLRKAGIQVLGFGNARVVANVNLKLFNRQGKEVFRLIEFAQSNETMKFALGGAVFEADKIQALCQDATDQLMLDMKNRLPKSVERMKKKLAKVK